jgi:cysteine desulfurase / selenocysteine lyase
MSCGARFRGRRGSLPFRGSPTPTDIATISPALPRSRTAGAFFCVDAMQGLGVLALDAVSVDADAVFAGGPKWMLALHGIAILYLGPRLAPRLELALPGWRSVENIWDFHNYEQPLSTDALRFEAGTPNLIGTISLVRAIELFVRSGKAAIERHALDLTDRLCEGLQRLGAEIATPRGRGVSSAIVTFSLPGFDSIELGRTLEEEGIVTTYRTGITPRWKSIECSTLWRRRRVRESSRDVAHRNALAGRHYRRRGVPSARKLSLFGFAGCAAHR